MINEFQTKKELCDIGQRIYQNGFVAANDGNFSVKISENEWLCTPTGISKGFMTPDMICKVDKDGNIIQANGKYKPSSEIKMHMRIYKLRPDVNSVVHAHPPYATAFAVAGIPLTQPILPESVLSLGCVPIAAYGMPSTNEIPDAVEKYLENYDAVLLENHGALSWGQDLITAYYKMEGIEYYAKLTALSMQIGGPKPLSQEQVHRLYDLRKKMGMPGRHPADLCIGKNQCGGGCHGDGASCKALPAAGGSDLEKIVEEVTRRVLASLK